MAAELKPCPFCGGSNIAFHQDYGVECDDCGATARDALIWNRRAEPADSMLVPVEPPLSLLPHLTNYAKVDYMNERDRAVILGRLRLRWTAILEALRPPSAANGRPL